MCNKLNLVLAKHPIYPCDRTTIGKLSKLHSAQLRHSILVETIRLSNWELGILQIQLDNFHSLTQNFMIEPLGFLFI